MCFVAEAERPAEVTVDQADDAVLVYQRDRDQRSPALSPRRLAVIIPGRGVGVGDIRHKERLASHKARGPALLLGIQRHVPAILRVDIARPGDDVETTIAAVEPPGQAYIGVEHRS